jgi:hypothetical protein
MGAVAHWGILCVVAVLGIQQTHAGSGRIGQQPIAPWVSGGPWAGQRPYAPPPKPAGWTDPEPGRWPWTGGRDPYADPERRELASQACGGDYVCIGDGSTAAVEWAARRGLLSRAQLSPDALSTGAAASERCTEVPVHVSAPSPEERRLACAGAHQAIQLLGRCEVHPRRPIDVRISDEVRLPHGREVFGFFDPKQERALVTSYANIPALTMDTPYATLPQREFYLSLIVHEVVHGVLHQHYERKPMTHAAYEYPAYALQIESLPARVRDEFLQALPGTGAGTNFVLSDPVLFFNPFAFAARAHKHFNTSPGGCSNLQALLKGQAAFIPPMPP